MFLLTTVAVHAQNSAEATTQVTALEETPVILPTNPFYFTKELVRDVRRFFTFGRVNKAIYELKVTDEKALEVRELEKISPDNAPALNKAIQNYNEDVARLKVRLESINETSQDERVDKLLNTLTKQTLRHVELLGELKDNTAITESVEIAESSMRDTVTSAVIKLDTPEKIEVRLEKAIEAQPTETAIEEKKAILLNVQTRAALSPVTDGGTETKTEEEGSSVSEITAPLLFDRIQ